MVTLEKTGFELPTVTHGDGYCASFACAKIKTSKFPNSTAILDFHFTQVLPNTVISILLHNPHSSCTAVDSDHIWQTAVEPSETLNSTAVVMRSIAVICHVCFAFCCFIAVF